MPAPVPDPAGAAPAGPTAIGIVHPGEMGAAVGRCLAGRGHRVLWSSRDRSHATARRAGLAGLADAGTIGDLAAEADVIVSICPPHAAAEVAAAVAAHGFRGRYVDANAISPQTARSVAAIVLAGGATYVDGGIIGPPPGDPGSTRLYLSGAAADSVRELFSGTALDATVATAGPFAASALKLAYAAWTKGSAALLLAARALADAEGVAGPLLAEWELSQPALAARLAAAETAAAAKGWRWTAEMEEIAAAMTAAGLPGGFGLAAAEIYRRWPRPDPANRPAQ